MNQSQDVSTTRNNRRLAALFLNKATDLHRVFRFAQHKAATHAVIFNWRHRTTDGGDHRSFYNIINNYFKPGPITPRDRPISHRFLKPESRRARPPVDDYGRAYVAGNFVEGNEKVSQDNWNGGVQVDSIGDADQVLASVRSETPYPHAYIEIQPAKVAYEWTLGRRLPRFIGLRFLPRCGL